MAIAPVGTATKTETASGTSVGITTVTGGSTGDLLIAAVGASGVSGITPPAGWTLITGAYEDASTTISVAGYYRVTTGSESGSYTWTVPSGASTGIMRRYSGVAGTAFDVPVTVDNGSPSTTVVVPSASSTLDGGMLLSAVVINATSSADVSAPSGMTIPTNGKASGTGRRTAFAEQLLGTAGGSGTKTWTLTAAARGAAWSVVLRPSSPGAVAAPTAGAGTDTTGTAGTVFTRTATETGSSITYRAWTIVSGPSGAGSTIATAAALSWTPPAAGTYVLRYSVTNPTATATDDMTLTVSAAAAGSTIAITATVEAGNYPPRVRLDVVDSSAVPYFAATVTRLNPDGTTSTVRTADGNPLVLTTSGATRVGLVYDYEMPYRAAVQYSTVEAPWSTSAQVTVPEDNIWLIHFSVPALSMPIELRAGSLQEEEWPVEEGVFTPMGREFPIVWNDGQRKAPQSSLTVVIESLVNLRALKALLADSAPLLLNIPATMGLGMDTSYIAVGSGRNRRLTDIGTDQNRNVELPFRVVDYPVGGSQSERSYADLLTYATYTDLMASYSTYLAVLSGP